MWIGKVITDFNGFCLFDPTLLVEHYEKKGTPLVTGSDLYDRFSKSDEGEEVVAAGLVVPVLAVDDSMYQLVVRLASEDFTPPGEILVTNGVYPLQVRERLVLADLAVLKEWWAEVAWNDIPMAPGYYGVTVRGFRELNEKGHVTVAGYEFILEPSRSLPAATADLSRPMDIIWAGRSRATQK